MLKHTFYHEPQAVPGVKDLGSAVQNFDINICLILCLPKYERENRMLLNGMFNKRCPHSQFKLIIKCKFVFASIYQDILNERIRGFFYLCLHCYLLISSVSFIFFFSFRRNRVLQFKSISALCPLGKKKRKLFNENPLTLRIEALNSSADFCFLNQRKRGKSLKDVIYIQTLQSYCFSKQHNKIVCYLTPSPKKPIFFIMHQKQGGLTIYLTSAVSNSK